MAAGGPVDTSPPSATEPVPLAEWVPSPAPLVASLADVEQVVARGSGRTPEDVLLVDARPAGRFAGTDPEPRAGLRPGHMPGARSVPFNSLLDSKNALLPADELRAVFEKAGVSVSRPGPIITTCGSGMTAVVLASALASLGRPIESTRVYDGSWAEWGQASLSATCNVVTGHDS